MVVFYRYTMAGITDSAKLNQVKLFENTIFTFPQQGEVTCSKAGTKEAASCIDAYKLISFSEAANSKSNKAFYQNMLGFKNITVQIVYPKPKDDEKGVCTKDKLTGCSMYVLYSNVPADAENKLRRTTPVSVYLPAEKKYAIGILTIDGYKVGGEQ
jgi:hypothetical protein